MGWWKRSVIEELIQKLPAKINNYYEPFVGGGALFFAIYRKVSFSYLSDVNIDLLVAYNTIKCKVKEIITALQKHKEKHNSDYYYSVRNMHELEDPVENTARFIYLLKTCYNGLYRVNLRNEFNTPIGSYKSPNILDADNLLNVSKALAKASIEYKDFSKIYPKKGDFVYFDPPYYPITKDSFTKYAKDGFTEKDQVRLRDFALDL